MIPLKPPANLPTHEVTNMPPHLGDQDLWQSDTALREGVAREGGGWAADKLAAFGKIAGGAEIFEKADLANRHTPELQPFDRYGMRINQVEFHPAYHELMAVAIGNEIPSFAWNHPQPGAQVVHAALTYMFNQPEGGVLCPMAMTYSAIPPLRMAPGVGDEWIPRLLSTSYDARDIPVEQKSGATMGMFMTEKQGGSDVRTNTTRAVADGDAYRLTGHKYFCSAPMSDAFLTLAYTDVGLSCFLVPRWTPDGERNNLMIQRLKDKLGNRSNASSEMEFQDTWGTMVGEDGRGVATILDMVQGNRYYCCFSSAALMRQGLVQAIHHTTHRTAFQKKLIQQPLMRNVLADLAIESEAALTLTLRIGRAMDEAAGDESAAALARIGTAVGKYWICKRAPGHTYEAMECHGGPGYIEESIMPRLYREAPVNSIWEGSGNIMCLDVLRAMGREKAAVPAVLAELEAARGGNRALDTAAENLKNELADPENLELRARGITELMAVTLQGALLVRHAPSAVADAFCASRLGPRWTGAYGALPASVDFDAIIDRAVT
ncbi:MAG: DNA alkylation response protein [Rhodospirillaceae bacterium]|jgi:putative acyl-CoA dehydrogenase|nr:DNA alkylation response protein [Rhodospirillaceae bacterium]MBT5191503.1 DNA alkylation response protein [Rhodospirillaceae bacterium]MBT5894737.1 DNA alkylation response protein [Rhodospirillaceae bacterium]